MEKLVFHQTISFHVLFFSCGLTCLEIKNIFFPFFWFVILAHFEKPKNISEMIRTFSMSFLAFFDFQNQKTKHPPEETKKTKKNEVKPKNNFST